MADFLAVIKQFINEKSFEQKLSSTGESNMREVGRKLANAKTKDEKELAIRNAIDAFCRERNYGRLMGGRERSELEKRLK